MTNASTTVEFTSSVTGSRLMEAVQAVAERGSNTRFASEKAFDDGYTFKVGQTSGYPYLQVVVGASSDDLTIRPDQHYQSCVVRNTSWPNNTYMVGYEDEAVVQGVQEFAASLKSEINGGEDAKDSPWPQSVMICAICQHILWRGMDQGWNCPTHGKNPPTHKQKVVPA